MIEVNKKVADFTIQTDEGKTVKLSDYAGQPVVLELPDGTQLPLAHALTPRQVTIILAGGLLNSMREA